ncbi:MAG TPA: hypothetical protein VFM88_15365 [Vicinamibacteria bacterium]|nr:hypothetical protein [Vicinamibacteria bacterium]
MLLFAAQSVGAARARACGDAAEELARRRALAPVVAAEHLLLLLALASGWLLLQGEARGYSHERWLALKLGLVAFLVVPMEAMHAFVAHGWTASGLRRTAAPPFDRRLERGLGIEEMLRTLAIPLFGIGVPLILWLSFKRPF